MSDKNKTNELALDAMKARLAGGGVSDENIKIIVSEMATLLTTMEAADAETKKNLQDEMSKRIEASIKEAEASKKASESAHKRVSEMEEELANLKKKQNYEAGISAGQTLVCLGCIGGLAWKVAKLTKQLAAKDDD